MFGVYLLLTLASAGAPSPDAAAASKPHLVFVMVDDWGWYDVGFRNPLIKTYVSTVGGGGTVVCLLSSAVCYRMEPWHTVMRMRVQLSRYLIIDQDVLQHTAPCHCDVIIPSPRPVIDGLVKNDAALLERHYVFKFCSPTRRSFLAGKSPFHNNRGVGCTSASKVLVRA